MVIKVYYNIPLLHPLHREDVMGESSESMFGDWNSKVSGIVICIRVSCNTHTHTYRCIYRYCLDLILSYLIYFQPLPFEVETVDVVDYVHTP